MRQWSTVGIAAAVVLVILGVVVFFFILDPVDDERPPITGPERAEDARALIAQLDRNQVDHDALFDRAQAFQRDGQLADAQLLYFYSARDNHAPSAFALGTMNDPNYHTRETSLLPEPNAFQAYRWYSMAHQQGIDHAGERLQGLRQWAEEAAAEGDREADQLLQQWER